jgi:hypothetical protein
MLGSVGAGVDLRLLKLAQGSGAHAQRNRQIARVKVNLVLVQQVSVDEDRHTIEPTERSELAEGAPGLLFQLLPGGELDLTSASTAKLFSPGRLTRRKTDLACCSYRVPRT